MQKEILRKKVLKFLHKFSFYLSITVTHSLTHSLSHKHTHTHTLKTQQNVLKEMDLTFYN